MNAIINRIAMNRKRTCFLKLKSSQFAISPSSSTSQAYQFALLLEI